MQDRAEAPDGWLEIVVETPSGSRHKYELDPGTGAVRLSRRLRAA